MSRRIPLALIRVGLLHLNLYLSTPAGARRDSRLGCCVADACGRP